MKKKLQNVSKKHPFIVPQNYFEEYEIRMLNILKQNNFSDSSKLPMASPDSYFENFEDSVLLAIKAKQFESNKIRPPFILPFGYFDSLEPAILKALEDKQSQNRLSLPRMNVWKKYSMIAVAASIALIAGVLFTLKMNSTGLIECNTTACLFEKVSPEEIKTELNNIELTDEELTDLISEKDLDELITSVVVTKKSIVDKPSKNKNKETTISAESVIPFEDEDLEVDFFDDI